MQVSTPCLLLVECPKVLPGVLVFTLILRRWLGDFLIPFDLNDQNVVAFLDKKVGVKVASLGMFALAPGIFDGVEALVRGLDSGVYDLGVLRSDQLPDEITFWLMVGQHDVQRRLEEKSIAHVLPGCTGQGLIVAHFSQQWLCFFITQLKRTFIGKNCHISPAQ